MAEALAEPRTAADAPAVRASGVLALLGYALLYGGAALLAARIVRGFAYSALRLTTLSYATQSPAPPSPQDVQGRRGS